MIFPVIKTEKIVQVNDATRIDVSATLSTNGDQIDTIEVKTAASEDYVSIDADDKYLDWIYLSEGSKTITVRINGDDNILKTHTLLVVTPEEDMLFSDDGDIIDLEGDILNYCKAGRNSHLNRHRKAQELILAELWKRGLRTKDTDDKITKDRIEVTPELNEWSKFLTLYLIYNDFKNTPDGILEKKANDYKYLANKASQDKQFLKIDLDGDGETEEVESSVFSSGSMVRR
ncbi:hypothetical protein [Kangiella sp.]|uniref:hypothetical protein n=1 Tax=Kangiella sp. TaxID=1920245 RepID=UPI003A900AAC